MTGDDGDEVAHSHYGQHRDSGHEARRGVADVADTQSQHDGDHEVQRTQLSHEGGPHRGGSQPDHHHYGTHRQWGEGLAQNTGKAR